jgi:hypothetical protein
MQVLMQNIVDGQETVKDNYFSESALQTEIETALNAVRREMRGFVVLAGRSAADGRFDLCIGMNDGSMILLELKRVRTNAIDYSGFGIDVTSCLPQDTLAKSWYREQYHAARECMKGLSDENLRSLAINPEWNKAKSVEELELKASTQCAKYLSDLTTRFPKRKICGFTVIQVGWRLLVKRVPVSRCLRSRLQI